MLYLTMVQTRIGIVNEASIKVAMAATIATRYSVVRRQSEISPGLDLLSRLLPSTPIQFPSPSLFFHILPYSPSSIALSFFLNCTSHVDLFPKQFTTFFILYNYFSHRRILLNPIHSMLLHKSSHSAAPLAREGEVKILDHLAQQQRVLPSISESYALRLSALRLYKFYEKVSENLFNRGDDSQLSEVSAVWQGSW